MSRKKQNSPTLQRQNRLRIIGGRWRGRKLNFPDIPGLRPTPDRLRETLFNWLSPALTEARCLDLFSGSGALGLEALSRGARCATIIDQSSKAVEQLRQNLSDLSCNSAELLQTDALQWLEKLVPGQLEPYDIIFLDPPFNQAMVDPCCQLLEQKLLVSKGAYIYTETEASWSGEAPLTWELHRTKTTGQIASRLFIAHE